MPARKGRKMMNKKMGSEAWGAEKLGSAAPIGAAAMGGGEGETAYPFELLLNVPFTYDISEGGLHGHIFAKPELAEPIKDTSIKAVYDGVEAIFTRTAPDGFIYAAPPSFGMMAVSFSDTDGGAPWKPFIMAEGAIEGTHMLSVFTKVKPKYVDG